MLCLSGEVQSIALFFDIPYPRTNNEHQHGHHHGHQPALHEQVHNEHQRGPRHVHYHGTHPQHTDNHLNITRETSCKQAFRPDSHRQ